MRVVSVNVGRPKRMPHGGRSVRTSIYKTPVAGRIAVRFHNLDGDSPGDPALHGGRDKAVYAYPSEHYAYWRETLGRDLEWSAFGENLTIAGLVEPDVCIGDHFRIGSAVLCVTQPRLPCYKLATKLERRDMARLFEESGRSGFYMSVVEEGELAAGDAIERVRESDHGVTVLEVNRLHRPPAPLDLLERALAVPELSGATRRELERVRAKSAP